MNEFLEEQTKGLKEMAENLRKSQLETARKAALRSAARVRSLNARAREMARSGVKLSNISHGTLERLIGLHEEIVTAALAEAATQIEKLAYTESARDFGRDQGRVLQAARERIVNDVSRGMKILREAAEQAREVGTRTTKAAPAARKPAARKAKARAAVRKAPRKAAARAKKAKSRRAR
jgi:hypothetical protein